MHTPSPILYSPRTTYGEPIMSDDIKNLLNQIVTTIAEHQNDSQAYQRGYEDGRKDAVAELRAYYERLQAPAPTPTSGSRRLTKGRTKLQGRLQRLREYIMSRHPEPVSLGELRDRFPGERFDALIYRLRDQGEVDQPEPGVGAFVWRSKPGANDEP